MKDSITWVGMDAHKVSINVAMRLPGRADFVEWTVANEPRALKRLARTLVREAQGGEVRCCYEAGPCGYMLARQLEAAAPLVCEVVAPALIPRKPGDRVKTNRRDARKLCELFAANLLTEVQRPSEHQEAVRDLVRCREDVREDLMRVRHQISKFLLRRAIGYDGRNWTYRHHKWLRTLRFDHPIDQTVFDSYLLTLEQTEERRRRLDEQLEKVAQDDREYRGPVGWMRCFRGINTVTALGVQAELFDLRRFPSPDKLMSFLGITPSEYSSGGHEKRGSVTKAGNRHVRRLLVEAAHHYRHPPAVGPGLRKRREGQPAQVLAIADKAQHRLNRRYHRLIARGVATNKAIVAVARELAGFLWAAAHHREVAA